MVTVWTADGGEELLELLLLRRQLALARYGAADRAVGGPDRSLGAAPATDDQEDDQQPQEAAVPCAR